MRRRRRFFGQLGRSGTDANDLRSRRIAYVPLSLADQLVGIASVFVFGIGLPLALEDVPSPLDAIPGIAVLIDDLLPDGHLWVGTSDSSEWSFDEDFPLEGDFEDTFFSE